MRVTVAVLTTGGGGGGGGVAEDPLAALTNDHLASFSTVTVEPPEMVSLAGAVRPVGSFDASGTEFVGEAMLPAAVIVKMIPVLAAAAAARRPMGPVTYSPSVVNGVTGRRSARYLPPGLRCDKNLPLLNIACEVSCRVQVGDHFVSYRDFTPRPLRVGRWFLRPHHSGSWSCSLTGEAWRSRTRSGCSLALPNCANTTPTFRQLSRSDHESLSV